MNNIFVTITGVNNYYGMKPFQIGKIFKLVKEPDNDYDSEAIRAELPMIDTIGYVANSVRTVYGGTVSAGRLYDKIGDYAFARTMFITHSSVIALVIPADEIEEITVEYTTKNPEPDIIPVPDSCEVESNDYDDVIDAHNKSFKNKKSIQSDKVCGCFYCCEIFSPSEIDEYIEEDDIGGETAICPYCGIDSVIGESSGYPITEEFLQRMNRYYF